MKRPACRVSQPPEAARSHRLNPTGSAPPRDLQPRCRWAARRPLGTTRCSRPRRRGGPVGLRRAGKDHIGVQLQRPLLVRRGERIVDHGDDPAVAGDPVGGDQVDQLQQQIGRDSRQKSRGWAAVRGQRLSWPTPLPAGRGRLADVMYPTINDERCRSTAGSRQPPHERDGQQRKYAEPKEIPNTP